MQYNYLKWKMLDYNSITFITSPSTLSTFIAPQNAMLSFAYNQGKYLFNELHLIENYLKNNYKTLLNGQFNLKFKSATLLLWVNAIYRIRKFTKYYIHIQ